MDQPVSEEAWMESARDGDVKALGRLYERYETAE
jgi:hypothetical protein